MVYVMEMWKSENQYDLKKCIIPCYFSKILSSGGIPDPVSNKKSRWYSIPGLCA